MDKAWAVRAGLGWLGKHSNVITPEHGSWVFIGELLLNLELGHDTEPIEDHCGTCTLCIDACPTGGDHRTLRGRLEQVHFVRDDRVACAGVAGGDSENLSGWLYGCDVCQDVCPWNRFEEATTETRFAPREGNVNAALADILELTPETYAARFRGSAMKRAKLQGLQRNARALCLAIS